MGLDSLDYFLDFTNALDFDSEVFFCAVTTMWWEQVSARGDHSASAHYFLHQLKDLWFVDLPIWNTRQRFCQLQEQLASLEAEPPLPRQPPARGL